MQIGAIFPTTEIGNDPVAIRDWAQAAQFVGEKRVGYAGPQSYIDALERFAKEVA